MNIDGTTPAPRRSTGNERPAGFGVLFHQTLEGDRDLVDGIGWRSGSMTKVHDRT
jgi:hypothetical protein